MVHVQNSQLGKAIGQRLTVGHLIANRARFLTDYRVADYVCSDQISDITINGSKRKTPAAMFFGDNYQQLVNLEGHPYGKQFNITFFDTFIVLELIPNSASTQFLVLVPATENELGLSSFSGMITATSVLNTLQALAQSRGEAEIFVEVADLLSYLSSVQE